MSVQEKKEIKVLKYIKKHEPVTKEKLYSKFPSLDDYFYCISRYVSIKDRIHIIDKHGYDTGEMMPVDASTYHLNRDGRIFFEQRREKFWSFWLPYSITTLIAIASLLAQFLN